MQKKTKDLFLKLKAIRPSIHSISYYYGIYPMTDKLVEYWYLEYPNKHIRCNSEKELQDLIIKLTNETSSDLGFRFPETYSKIITNEENKIDNK